MTKITSNNTALIYRLVKKNPNLVLAASDHEVIFADNVDTSDIEKTFSDEIKVQKDFSWTKIS